MLENDTYKFVSYHGCCSKVPLSFNGRSTCILFNRCQNLTAFKAPRENDELVCPLENSLKHRKDEYKETAQQLQCVASVYAIGYHID